MIRGGVEGGVEAVLTGSEEGEGGRSFLGEGGKTDTQTRGKLVVQEVALFGGPDVTREVG